MTFRNTYPMPIDAASNPPLYGRIANPTGEDLILFAPCVDLTVATGATSGTLKLYASQDGSTPTGPAIATLYTNGSPRIAQLSQAGCGLWPADHYLILVVDSGDPTGTEGTIHLQWIYT